MRAGAAVRVRRRRLRPGRSRVRKTSDPVWRAVPAAQVGFHLCCESDNRVRHTATPPGWRVSVRMENELETL